MVQCPNCRSSLNEGLIFCPNCGHSLTYQNLIDKSRFAKAPKNKLNDLNTLNFIGLEYIKFPLFRMRI